MSAEKVEQNENGKVEKQFQENIKTLNALFGSDEPLKGKRGVKKDRVGGIVEQMLKEEEEAKALELKSKLKEIITKKLAYDKALKEEEKKLAKFKEDKMKEFNTACQGILDAVQGWQELKKEYHQALGSVASTATVSEEDADPA